MIHRLYLLTNVHPLPNHVYRLNDELVIHGVKIPKGYITNGADIPIMLRPIQAPNDSSILPAVIAHDYLCDIAKYHFSLTLDIEQALIDFRKADQLFKDTLLDLKRPNYQIQYLYQGVSNYTRLWRPMELQYRKIRKKPYNADRLYKILQMGKKKT